MSFSRPQSGAVSPVKQYLQWNSQDGVIEYWDKEKQANVPFPKMKFIVLDTFNTVRGFQPAAKGEKKGKPIRGTEVRRVDEPITVYIAGTKYTSDTWANLKSIPGIKYAISMYLGFIKKDGTMDIMNMVLSGGAVGAWIAFTKGQGDYEGKGTVDTYKSGISITGKSAVKTQGAAKWVEPLFGTWDIDDAKAAEATALDEILQAYFDKRQSSDGTDAPKKQTPAANVQNNDDDDGEVEDDEEADAEDLDDLPF